MMMVDNDVLCVGAALRWSIKRNHRRCSVHNPFRSLMVILSNRLRRMILHRYRLRTTDVLRIVRHLPLAGGGFTWHRKHLLLALLLELTRLLLSLALLRNHVRLVELVSVQLALQLDRLTLSGQLVLFEAQLMVEFAHLLLFAVQLVQLGRDASIKVERLVQLALCQLAVLQLSYNLLRHIFGDQINVLLCTRRLENTSHETL